MPQATDEEAVRQLEQRIIDVYATAQRQIDAEQAAIVTDPRQFRRRARLTEMRDRIDALMADVDQQAAQWLDADLPRVYVLGGTRADLQVASMIGGAAARQLGGFNQVSREAVTRIAEGLHTDLLKATTLVRESTKELIREGLRQAVIGSVVGGGTPIAEARKAARALIEDHGIHAVVYRDGSKHQLGDYAEMAVRTQTALAYNEGIFSSASASDLSFMEVLDGPGCGWSDHDDPDIAAGSIRPVDECMATPISHPNCRRNFAPRPDVIADDATPADSPAGRAGLATVALSQARPFWSEQTPAARPAPAAAKVDTHARRLAQRQQRLDARAASVKA